MSSGYNSEITAADAVRNILFLPMDHNPKVAARLRGIGWRTIGALSPEDDARTLGCTHILAENEARPL